jgi:UDP-N-acetylglucosamine 2-epimerase (non-hydrolysing)
MNDQNINKKRKILVAIGTRPEAIKMAPLIIGLKKNPNFIVTTLSTGQHKEMIQNIIELFQLEIDFDLSVMKAGQSLTDLTNQILAGCQKVFQAHSFDLVLVHGDTTTSMAVSLSAFYHKISIGHVEAGLRTHNMEAPWPEEMNRRVNSVLAQYHFAPTALSKLNLVNEGIDEQKIIVTGNTVIDALLLIRSKAKENTQFINKYSFLDQHKKLILVTCHRRENFGEGVLQICQALKEISKDYRDEVEILYPVHLNPNISHPVKELLVGEKNIHLIEPVDYEEFIFLMDQSYLILTDSGGVQEEAPSLGKPVLVLREVTERPEAVEAGTVLLVGTDKNKIKEKVSQLINNDNSCYDKMSTAHNPYGDGHAVEKIIKLIE